MRESAKEIDALTDPAARFATALQHPLLAETELLVTRPIEELYRHIKRAVFLHESGYCFIAPSGTGKTFGLRAAVRMLLMQMPNIPIVRLNALNQQMPSIRAFFKYFLDTIEHPELKGETIDLRLRLERGLLDRSLHSGLGMLVLFIDEAQAMTIEDFKFLKDVDNGLADENVKLIAILIGQTPTFETTIDDLIRNRHWDLIGRFARRRVPFRAYSNIEDIAQILDGIDNSIYPAKNGWSWTQFFFPKAYASGFRLRNEASNFLSALAESGYGMKSPGTYPARAFFIAIRAFMVDNSPADSEDLRISPNAWHDAVDYAQMKEAMILMGGGDMKHEVEMET